MHAEEAREQAHQTYQDAHSKASQTRDFTPSPELKRMYREAAKRMHPDLARDAADRERRTQMMAESNRAYEAGDTEGLERILHEYMNGADAVQGEGMGAELIRLIRQIIQAKDRLAAIEQEMVALAQSEIALLKNDVAEKEQQGRDLLAELARAIREQIELAKQRYEAVDQHEVQSA